MEAGSGHRRLISWGRLATCMMFCSLLVAACGTPPPDHPLTTGSAIDGSPTASTASPNTVVPMHVVTSQTNLTAYPGGYMTLTISTSPNAICSIEVAYGLGAPSKAFGIVPETASASGVATWRWQVESSARTGTWPLTISALLASGARASVQVNVSVSLAPISVVGNQTTLAAYPKQNMVLTIATAPSIACLLLLNYGPGRTVKTLTSRSNSSGLASWTWRVDNTAAAGVWPLTITAVLADGERSTAQVNMSIL